MDNEVISICFCINDIYAQHLAVVLTSILKNNKDSFFKFYVLSNDITEISKNKIDLLKKKYQNYNIEYLGVNKDLFTNFDLTIDYITIETYFRYILPDIFPNLKKILYMDVDLVVNGNIKTLWNTDISEYYCAGVEDINIDTTFHKKNLNMDESDTYINAGVLLFNLDKMRKDFISQKLFETHKQYSNVLKYQDQDVINIVLRKKIKLLEFVYNFSTKISKKYPKLAKDAKIIHFIGPKKPWKTFSANKLKLLYYYYRFFSPYSILKNITT